MKKYIAIILVSAILLTACDQTTTKSKSNRDVENEIETSISGADDEAEKSKETVQSDIVPSESNEDISLEELSAIMDSTYEDPVFDGPNDPRFISFVRDNMYASMEAEFSSEDYIIQSITPIYIPQEYIEELSYNTKSNIYFGYTEAELNEMFEGRKYVFTLDEHNETTVEELQLYDDAALRKMIINTAIGSGVILVCVTVAVVSGVAAVKTEIPVFSSICVISGTAALESIEYAFSGGVMGAIAAGTIEYYKTGDKNKALLQAGLAGSEAFKWGAIAGAVKGSVDGALVVATEGASIVATEVPTWQESEEYVTYMYGGESQLSYLNGSLVEYGTANATRPDVVKFLDSGAIEAIEVKNYELANPQNVRSLAYVLKEEVSDRIINMPEGTLQRIVLDTRGRNYDEMTISFTKEYIWNYLRDVYPNIPIDVLV